MFKETWNDRTPARRCDWIDQLRGWAVILMIEVHVVNVWLQQGLLPGWLNFVNGLVAPSFLMCAGYSLALSTFRSDDRLRPFARSAKRLAFILLCAYALHAPGFTLAAWTVLGTPRQFRELFQIDVLQCIVFSLLILQGLARIIRRPLIYAAAALVLALGAALAAPALWRPGVADGWWLPVRGLINGNTDQGVASLFPLFPWFAFVALGSVLGAVYRHFRVMSHEGQARWSESRWLVALAMLGGVLCLWGSLQTQDWLGVGAFRANAAGPPYNTTLPSVAERLGIVCMAGALLGWVEMIRGSWRGPNWVQAAGRESLLLYMLHLNLIFGVLLMDSIQLRTGWHAHSLGRQDTCALTVMLIAVNLAAALAWQNIRKNGELARKINHAALVVMAGWFLIGGWYG
jgi:uncharacterized membrane protein